MSKSLFRSITLIITFTVIPIAIIINISEFINIIGFTIGILRPVAIGFVMAFILNRPYLFIQRILSEIFHCTNKSKALKFFSMLLLYILSIAFILLIIGLIVPQIGNSFNTLKNNIDIYTENITVFLSSTEMKLGLDFSLYEQIVASLPSVLKNIPSCFFGFMPNIFATAGSIASTVYDWFIGFALSIYMLTSKTALIKQIKCFVYAYFPIKFSKKLRTVCLMASDIYGDFFAGQIINALSVGLICMIFMSIFKFDYAFLISVLVAITNIIPMFGPFIGIIPSAFLLLMINPSEAFWFIVFIAIVQQIDGNVIYPRIVGKSIGLPTLWIFIAILLGGGLFGVIGMIVGVPFFCIVYRLIGMATRNKKYTQNS